MWFTSVSGIASSLTWVCDVGTVLSVLFEVVEVGMLWGCHVRCAGSGLVLCSGRVLYVANVRWVLKNSRSWVIMIGSEPWSGCFECGTVWVSDLEEGTCA